MPDIDANDHARHVHPPANPAPARHGRRTLLALAVAGAAGLAVEGVDARRRRKRDGTSGGSVPGGSGATGPTTGGEAIPVAAIVADAAQVLGVPVSAVTVVFATHCLWPDTSLGCPLPGHAYAQHVTPGYRVVVAGPDGTRLDYRGSDGDFARCTRPRTPSLCGHGPCGTGPCNSTCPPPPTTCWKCEPVPCDGEVCPALARCEPVACPTPCASTACLPPLTPDPATTDQAVAPPDVAVGGPTRPCAHPGDPGADPSAPPTQKRKRRRR